MAQPGQDPAVVGEDSEVASQPIAPAKPSRPKAAHVGLLYRGATCLDRLGLAVGVVTAVLHGATTPLFMVCVAESVKVMATVPREHVSQEMSGVALVLSAISAGSFICSVAWTSIFFWFAGRQTARLRTEYFSSVITCDISWFDQNQPAALPSRLVTDAKAIHDAIGFSSGQFVVYISQFLVGMGTAFIRGWELTLILCSVIPIIGGGFHILAHRLHGAKSRENACLARASAVAEEALLAPRTVAAFGAEAGAAARLEAELRGAWRSGMRAALCMGCNFGPLLCSFACAYALALWYSAHHMVANGRYSPTDVIVVILAVIFGVGALGGLEAPLQALAPALAASASVAEVLDARPLIERGGEEAEPAGLAAVESLEFRDVCFSYPSRPDVPVLQGLSLFISQGQKVALVGASGSGKSTVVQLLERFYDPVSGSILVNGIGLQQLPVHGWRRLLGYVGQEPVLFQCSVLENIRAGSPSATDAQALEAAKQAEAFDFISGLPQGFDTCVGVGGSQVSGGQKQRIAIARALVRRPQVLVLDEATSALDNESEKLVQATLDQLQSEACSGLTTITVAHRLSTIRNADTIFVLKDGRVVEQGPHEELFERRGEYFGLVQAQGTVQAGCGEQASDSDDEQSGHARNSALMDLAPSPVSRVSAPSTVVTKATPAVEEAEAQGGGGGGVRRLLGQSRPEWAYYLLGLVSALLSSMNLPVSGLILSHGYTSLYVQPADDMLAMIDRSSLYLVLVGLGLLVGEMGKHGFFGYIQQCLILRLRRDAFASVLRQEVGFFDDPRTDIASMGSRMARSAMQVSDMMGMGVGNTAQSLFGIIVGLALGFLGSVKLTLVVLATMPVVAVSMTVTSVVLTDSNEAESHSLADTTASAAVLNIRTLRAFGAEPRFQEIYSGIMLDLSRVEARSALKKGLAKAFSDVVILLVYLTGMWYGGALIRKEGLDAARVFQSLLCVTLGFSGADLAAHYGPIMRQGRAAAAEIFRLIDRRPKINTDIPAGQLRDIGNGTIEFQDVSFRFPHRWDQRVLKRLKFTVTKGQAVALVGPSGSGKSTVLQLLLRFYDPTRGAVRVGGADLCCFDLAWWRRQLGFVGQEPVLFDMSLEDNVKYGCPEATRAEVEAAAREAHLDFALEGAVAWHERLGLRGERLSGGQRQRCALARALVRRPQVLLLDEATSALDSASENAVQRALDDARKGRTTFTIAHRISTIRDSDLILVVSSGKIIEKGTHDELVARQGWYAQMAPPQ